MACAKHSQIGAIGSVYFLGWVLSLIFTSRLSDIYGRHVLLIFGTAMVVILYACVLLTTKLWLMLVWMFLTGLMVGIKSSMGFVYLLEFQVESKYPVVGLIEGFSSNAFALAGVIYFDMISKNWIWLVLFGAIGESICFILILFLPESPKFLIMQRRFNEASKVL